MVSCILFLLFALYKKGQTYPLDSTRYGHVRRAHQAPNSLHLIRLGRRQRDSETVKPPQKKKKAVSVKKISKPRKMAQSSVPTNRVSQRECHRNVIIFTNLLAQKLK